MNKRDYLALPRPSDIATYIEAYYQYKFLGNDDTKILVESLENLIKNESSPAKKQYLVLYYGTICDVADSLSGLEKDYNTKKDEIKNWYKHRIEKIENNAPQKKKEIERAFSYGLEALLSYYITQALITYVPEDVSTEATGGIMFISFLFVMYTVDEYYRHKKSKLYSSMSRELNKLKEWYTDKKRELFSRGEIRASLYWKEYIEGKRIVKDTVNYVARRDGTGGVFSYLISKFKTLISK